MDIAELFKSLESNQAQAAEEVKKKFHEYLNKTKDPWLMNGLFDYYLASGSYRVVEIIVGVREPHEKYLFDRICESLKGSSKLQGLTLLGHVVRRNPTWLYKITQHNLTKDLLKLLKVETDMLSVMSALLVVIVLLPMIAGFISPHLQEIFEVFSRLASWNTNNPNKISEGYLLHLQVGLYALFHRLYGMFPCNFLAYLRNEYSKRSETNISVFSHTIKPMLETVKMHPLLVIAAKDAEIAPVRWKKMEPHDVIVECAKFTVENSLSTVNSNDKYKDDSLFQHSNHNSSHCNRSSLECDGVLDGSYTSRGVRAYSSQLPSCSDKDVWTPNAYCGGAKSPESIASAPTSIPHTPISQTFAVNSSFPQQEGTSPPEAAVEATPETTPIKDLRQNTRSHPLVTSSVVRALNSALVSAGSGSPMHSQPSSPMKKEPSPFRFPPDNCSAFQQLPRNISTISPQLDPTQSRGVPQKFQRIMLERIQLSETQMQEIKSPIKQRTPVSSSSANNFQPTSPLRVIQGAMFDHDNPFQLVNSPHSFTEDNQEDKEVESTMKGGNDPPIASLQGSSNVGRQCDSVLQEHDGIHVEEGLYDECEQEAGFLCASGGLHMPNSQSMRDFARQVNRLRYYSYNHGSELSNRNDISALSETRSSLSESSSFADIKVRRAFSCPEMKKSTSVSTLSVGDRQPFNETDEEEEVGEDEIKSSKSNKSLPSLNGHNRLSVQITNQLECKEYVSNGTQTENTLPYEHLFLNVFPYIEQQHHTPPPDTCNMPSLFPNKTSRFSPYQAVENFINTTVHCYDNKKSFQGVENELKLCKDQLILLNLQLQFERHRREVHAERNRRLLGKSRNNRSLEEHNSALRDQVSILQHDKDNLHGELENHKRDLNDRLQKMQQSEDYWKDQNKNLQKAWEDYKASCETLQKELNQEREKTAAVTKKWNDTEAQLIDTRSQLQQALSLLSAGREVKEELQTLQREVVIGGEVQQRNHDTLAHIVKTVQHTCEFSLQRDAYLQQVEALNENLRESNSKVNALTLRVEELESLLERKNKLFYDKDCYLEEIQLKYKKQLQKLEDEYKSYSLKNIRLEENIGKLNHQIATIDVKKTDVSKSSNTTSTHSNLLPSSSSFSNQFASLPLRNLHSFTEDTEVPSSVNHPSANNIH